ncbi:MAG: hypothetical protein IPL01_22685 [Acidobacteria bacterium]|nr:hypothetical protein [Acidobacteriota bacterium]
MVEQGLILNILDKEVEREYLEETGGEDIGLVVLDSLKLWRKRGWRAAKQPFKIKVFAQIDQTNHTEVKRAIFLDVGVGLGLRYLTLLWISFSPANLGMLRRVLVLNRIPIMGIMFMYPAIPGSARSVSLGAQTTNQYLLKQILRRSLRHH